MYHIESRWQAEKHISIILLFLIWKFWRKQSRFPARKNDLIFEIQELSPLNKKIVWEDYFALYLVNENYRFVNITCN